MNLELGDSLYKKHKFCNITEEEHDNVNINEYNDNADRLLYSLSEVQEIISKQFQRVEESNEPVKLAFEIELDSRLVECIFPEYQPDICDLETIKKNFQQLVNVLILSLKYRSGYYWKMRQIHLITRKKKPTGNATAYLGCSHEQAHEHPQYRKVVFLAAAKQWIQDNIEFYLHNSEVYKRLQLHKLIDVQIHTKEQVYYWTSIFSKHTYMFNFKNQLISTKEYLERQQFFKIIYYLENDFIKTLGFTTLLINHIGITNIKEIIVDSTFKTNQEYFEFFAINTNCGGYGIPIAYLYFLTCDSTAKAYNDLKNQINTRVQTLREFFIRLRNEKLLPIFVLIDKDAGEISAIQEAWSWTANLQLCY
ncbi:hypothetical protein RclHR1_12670001 [Rhizophagus clarus]|uniref:MULE transposase domain-containing protein n=1 Tax=Rhizophagus clarus TaxID=94130 RepID=A0A2Z6R049_9GLOM|nr:hypothetical protein RclHR1_12670001 [Rhizophagus clarus]GES89087.1 hypothetical protein GLOIN_2v1847703 [Rhizophagus clarus]